MRLIHYISALLIVLSMQLTDFRISEIKIGDFFSTFLLLYFCINHKNVNIPVFYKKMYLCFCFFLISSFTVILWTKFYPPNTNLSIFKQVGMISISRFIQLIGCLTFSLFIHNILIKHTVAFDDKFLKIIDRLMLLFFFFFILVFFMSFFQIETLFVYGNHRLRGGFVEGGPFGLFAVFYYVYRTKMFKFSTIWTILIIILLFASQSKAAVLFLIFIVIIYLILYNKLKIKNTIIAGFISFIILILLNNYWGFTNRLIAYWDTYKNIKYVVPTRVNDPSLVMGRIAAAYIAPEIIKNNILLGVGLGNYSLVRNNPEYLGIFPIVSEWDLMGFGGIINILIEVGIIGLFLFILPFLKMWQLSKLKTTRFLIILFMIAQIFGVQTYFQYLWFVVGIMTAINMRHKNSILT
ncbi:hypothetical protein EZS27_007639 [termite gut metagenome]|uniref:O-antigen ligase-related domain-containing protein n=1 Tax=termite gut metagenome TaxID=433724 RepID=A0A5J4SF28_9ZZZZ